MQIPDLADYMRSGTLQFASLPPLSLYVHLPWCIQKCPYCDFNSHEIKVSEMPGEMYISALMADLEVALPLVWGRVIHSVFIGGGTPSLFDPEAIDKILSGVRSRLNLLPNCEVTLEANPGTFEKDRFRGFRSAGVNRLSVGVQSFDDRFLKTLGRVHDSSQAFAAVEEVAQAFDTFNLDIMYALPGQSVNDLVHDVEKALSVSPSHISIYQLTLEPNTFFSKFPPILPELDVAYDMLDVINDMTEQAGLNRYEVSAYSLNGHRCAHNLNYWQFGDYLGIGAGAHSKLSFPHRIVRQVRYREPRMYMKKALAGESLAIEEDVNRIDLPFEFMLNALRLKDGVSLEKFTERTGLAVTAIEAALIEAEQQGLLDRDINYIKPSVKGYDFLNNLQALFLPKN